MPARGRGPWGRPPALALGFDTSAGEKVQQWLPGAKVVKAYNTVGAPLMVDPSFQGGLKGDMFIAGDNADAKSKVADLIRGFGWDVVDAGPLAMSRHLEPMCIVWVQVGLSTGKWNHAFELDPHLTGVVLYRPALGTVARS